MIQDRPDNGQDEGPWCCPHPSELHDQHGCTVDVSTSARTYVRCHADSADEGDVASRFIGLGEARAQCRDGFRAGWAAHLASGRAGAGEQQREQVARWLWKRDGWTEQQFDAAGPETRGWWREDAAELLALLGGPQPDGQAVAEARACWCAHCEGIVLAADHPTNWVARIGGRRFIVCRDCGDKRCPRAAHHDRPCAYREPCPVYSHGTDGWHCAVTGDHDQHTNAAGDETW